MMTMLLWFTVDRWYMRSYLVRYGFPGPESVTRKDYLNLRDSLLRSNAYGCRRNRLIRKDIMRLLDRGYRLRFPHDE